MQDFGPFMEALYGVMQDDILLSLRYGAYEVFLRFAPKDPEPENHNRFYRPVPLFPPLDKHAAEA